MTRSSAPSFLGLFVVALALGCDSPAATDAGVDSGPGTDAPIVPRDTGGPDAPTACQGGTACTLVPNAGCSGSEFCAYAYTGGMRTNECIAPGARLLGESCTMNTDCTAGHSCLAGFCVEVCCPGAMPSTCTAGTTCGAFDVNVGMGMTDAVGICSCTIGGAACPAGSYCDPITMTQGLCLRQGTCNRLTQDCPTDQGCYGTVRECLPVGSAAENDACMRHSDCAAGLWCRADSPTSSVCSRYCEVGGPAVCGAGLVCTSFGDDQPMVGGCYPM